MENCGGGQAASLLLHSLRAHTLSSSRLPTLRTQTLPSCCHPHASAKPVRLNPNPNPQEVQAIRTAGWQEPFHAEPGAVVPPHDAPLTLEQCALSLTEGHAVPFEHQLTPVTSAGGPEARAESMTRKRSLSTSVRLPPPLPHPNPCLTRTSCADQTSFRARLQVTHPGPALRRAGLQYDYSNNPPRPRVQCPPPSPSLRQPASILVPDCIQRVCKPMLGRWARKLRTRSSFGSARLMDSTCSSSVRPT